MIFLSPSAASKHFKKGALKVGLSGWESASWSSSWEWKDGRNLQRVKKVPRLAGIPKQRRLTGVVGVAWCAPIFSSNTRLIQFSKPKTAPPVRHQHALLFLFSHSIPGWSHISGHPIYTRSSTSREMPILKCQSRNLMPHVTKSRPHGRLILPQNQVTSKSKLSFDKPAHAVRPRRLIYPDHLRSHQLDVSP